jgi:hypothetical protein
MEKPPSRRLFFGKGAALDLLLSRSSACDGVINYQDNNSTHDCHEHAVDVHAIDSLGAEYRKQVSSYYRTDHAQDDVKDNTFALFVYDFTCDKSGDQTQNNPADDRH